MALRWNITIHNCKDKHQAVGAADQFFEDWLLFPGMPNGKKVRLQRDGTFYDVWHEDKHIHVREAD